MDIAQIVKEAAWLGLACGVIVMGLAILYLAGRELMQPKVIALAAVPSRPSGSARRPEYATARCAEAVIAVKPRPARRALRPQLGLLTAGGSRRSVSSAARCFLPSVDPGP